MDNIFHDKTHREITTLKISRYNLSGEKLQTYDNVFEVAKRYGKKTIFIKGLINKKMRFDESIWVVGDMNKIDLDSEKLISCYDKKGEKVQSFWDYKDAANFLRIPITRIKSIINSDEPIYKNFFWMKSDKIDVLKRK